jgi:hypothetical protein
VTAKRRDRVDGKGDVGNDDRDDDEQERRAVETPSLADEQPATPELRRGRDGASDEAQSRVRGRVGRLVGAPQRAIRDVEEQDAERVDDGLNALDQRQPGGDRHAAEDERAGDADDDDPASQLRRHEEVGEQEREEEDVVERERALDQIDGRPLAGWAARQCDSRRNRAGKEQPADAPECRFAPAR